MDFTMFNSTFNLSVITVFTTFTLCTAQMHGYLLSLSHTVCVQNNRKSLHSNLSVCMSCVSPLFVFKRAIYFNNCVPLTYSLPTGAKGLLCPGETRGL